MSDMIISNQDPSSNDKSKHLLRAIPQTVMQTGTRTGMGGNGLLPAYRLGDMYTLRGGDRHGWAC